MNILEKLIQFFRNPKTENEALLDVQNMLLRHNTTAEFVMFIEENKNYSVQVLWQIYENDKDLFGIITKIISCKE